MPHNASSIQPVKKQPQRGKKSKIWEGFAGKIRECSTIM